LHTAISLKINVKALSLLNKLKELSL